MDHHYDIAIIGLGCAGAHVVLELLRCKPDLRIVVMDNAPQQVDKKWSYWEKGTGKWDHLILKKWNHGIFKSASRTIALNLNPYIYKTIDSTDFIAFAKTTLEHHPNTTFIHTTVTEIVAQASGIQEITHTTGKTQAQTILDSRIDPAFFKDKKAITLQQHFKGWTVETPVDSFNPDCFTMMDYSLRDTGTTSFTYVLPYSKRKALVEFTYFAPDLVDDATYDSFLKEYISQRLHITDYEVTAIEQGIIPMSTYDFAQHNTAHIHKIGTAGGWVKPSTGYSFKMSEKKAALLVSNYFAGKPLNTGLFPTRFKIHDRTMLDVLYNFNDDGPDFFETLYSGNDIKKLFRFLDEETRLQEEVLMMKSMTSLRMIKAFFKNLL